MTLPPNPKIARDAFRGRWKSMVSRRGAQFAEVGFSFADDAGSTFAAVLEQAMNAQRNSK